MKLAVASCQRDLLLCGRVRSPAHGSRTCTVTFSLRDRVTGSSDPASQDQLPAEAGGRGAALPPIEEFRPRGLYQTGGGSGGFTPPGVTESRHQMSVASLLAL